MMQQDKLVSFDLFVSYCNMYIDNLAIHILLHNIFMHVFIACI